MCTTGTVRHPPPISILDAPCISMGHSSGIYSTVPALRWAGGRAQPLRRLRCRSAGPSARASGRKQRCGCLSPSLIFVDLSSFSISKRAYSWFVAQLKRLFRLMTVCLCRFYNNLLYRNWAKQRAIRGWRCLRLPRLDLSAAGAGVRPLPPSPPSMGHPSGVY